jgi:hypothetical protein
MRSGFGSNGVTALKEHFEAIGATTNASCRAEAVRLLKDNIFVFGTFKTSRRGNVS